MEKKVLLVVLGGIPLMGWSYNNDIEADKTEKRKPNVLFICVDDLRRELGCYGSIAKTPNIDRLADEGSLFFNHYVQVPTSGASRASMLTGHLPRRTSDLSNEACRLRCADRPEGELPETMFHHLRRNGYYTVGIGMCIGKRGIRAGFIRSCNGCCITNSLPGPVWLTCSLILIRNSEKIKTIRIPRQPFIGMFHGIGRCLQTCAISPKERNLISGRTMRRNNIIPT